MIRDGNKKMPIQIIQCLNLYKTLHELTNGIDDGEQPQEENTQKKSVKFPAKVAYAISKNLTTLYPIIYNFETFKRNKYLAYQIPDSASEENTEKTSDGFASAEAKSKFETEIMEHVNGTVEIAIHKITLSDMGNFEISPTKMNELESFGMLVAD